MRWMELSSPTFVAFISKAPNWLTVPLETSSPDALVHRQRFARHDRLIRPRSAPRRSRRRRGWSRRAARAAGRRPCTCLGGHGCLARRPVMTRAVCGVRWTSFSMPARARATVSSSSRPPSCMMKATSPAAKSSPMQTEAISASETSTSALMSNAVTRPMTASRMMGMPQRMIAAHAGVERQGDEIENADDQRRRRRSRAV